VAKYSEEGYGSEGAVLAMMMMTMMTKDHLLYDPGCVIF
jgi:hypothetical protein